MSPCNVSAYKLLFSDSHVNAVSCLFPLCSLKSKLMQKKNTANSSNTHRYNITDVAKRAKVSTATVSRYLNKSAIISDLKASAIKAAIKELNYHPNRAASRLAGGSSKTIAVVTQCFDSPFFGDGHRGIGNACDELGFTPIFLAANWDVDRERSIMKELDAHSIDGVLYFFGQLQNPDAYFTNMGIPYLIMHGSPTRQTENELQFDNYGGGQLAGQYLIEEGHRQFWYMKGLSTHPDAEERFRGFHDAVYNSKHACHIDVLEGDFTEKSGYELGLNLLTRSGTNSATAVAFANDQMAIGFLLAAHERGVSIPGDLSIIGFDNVIASEFCIPPLTTIDHDIETVGYHATKTLLTNILGEKQTGQPPRPKLIKRKSVTSIS